MLDRQRLWRNGPGLILLVSGLFLALSLLGYDPEDAPGSAAWPANEGEMLSNPCGPVGANLAHVLFTLVGWASVLVLPAWVIVTIRSLRGQPIPDPAVRLFGTALLIGVAAATIQELKPDLPNAPPVGAGGYGGALIASELRGQFGPIGMALFLGSATVVGLACCHDLIWTPSRRRAASPATAAGLVPSPMPGAVRFGSGPRSTSGGRCPRDSRRRQRSFNGPSDFSSRRQAGHHPGRREHAGRPTARAPFEDPLRLPAATDGSAGADLGHFGPGA